MAINNTATAVLAVGIVVAIIMSSAALVGDINLEEKEMGQEQYENLQVGAPGVNTNEFYIFTQELNADEEKFGVPVAVFTLTQITVHKGDNVTIHFINPAEEPADIHSFSMEAPYQMHYHLDGGQSTEFSFTADTVGTFTYYCKYDLPSMTGQLIVLP